MLLRGTAATAVFLALACPAAAQDGSTGEAPAMDTEPARNVFNQMNGGRLAASQMRATEMIGFPVYTRDGEQIGEVGEVVIDTAAGTVDMVVVETDGFLGLSENRYGVKWSEVAFNRADRKLSLSLTADEVGTAPEKRDEQTGR